MTSSFDRLTSQALLVTKWLIAFFLATGIIFGMCYVVGHQVNVINHITVYSDPPYLDRFILDILVGIMIIGGLGFPITIIIGTIL